MGNALPLPHASQKQHLAGVFLMSASLSFHETKRPPALDGQEVSAIKYRAFIEEYQALFIACSRPYPSAHKG
jgi:hypothetical protein